MGEIYKDNGRLSLRHKSEDIVMTVKHVKWRAKVIISKAYRQLTYSAIQCPTTLNCRRIGRTDVQVKLSCVFWENPPIS